jgi:hypothetical protein
MQDNYVKLRHPQARDYGKFGGRGSAFSSSSSARRDLAEETVVAARSDVGAMGMVTRVATSRQIGSECLIMPDTCLD